MVAGSTSLNEDRPAREKGIEYNISEFMNLHSKVISR